MSQSIRTIFAGTDIKNSSIRYDEPMRNHTSFKLGGAADVLVEPESIQELQTAIRVLEENGIPYYIIGNGTNLLVSDQGIRGAIVKLGDKFGKVEITGEEITAECGVLLSTLSKAAARESLTGLEFASGIPGAVGGAIAMNAGAYDGEMKDVVKWVEVLDKKLEVVRLSNEQMHFGYRKSIVEPEGLIVLSCCVGLKKGDQQAINDKMADLAVRRKTKQPLHLPSAGSTFKRPEGYFASKLIEDAGLKGYSIGGAQVSPLHSGFVVNNGGATAREVYELIRHVQNTVYSKSNVKLEPEVKILGEF